jgi:hypothetical protein
LPAPQPAPSDHTPAELPFDLAPRPPRPPPSLPQSSPDQLKALVLRVHHDEDVEVYINGVRAFSAPGVSGRYENVKISDEALRAIDPAGKNVLAAHCHQTVGGQYLDVEVVRRESNVNK